jgi:hypothetical protein
VEARRAVRLTPVAGSRVERPTAELAVEALTQAQQAGRRVEALPVALPEELTAGSTPPCQTQGPTVGQTPPCPMEGRPCSWSKAGCRSAPNHPKR